MKTRRRNAIFRTLVSLFMLSLVSAFGAAPVSASGKPQVIKLQRFRKALWKVNVSVKGRSGDFLLDTGGGVTLLANDFAKNIDCKFWGRTIGYNMFGERSEGPHCDNVEITAGSVPLTSVNVGTIDFGDRFAGDKTPDGLLSLDAFDGKIITLDQRAATLTIETNESLAERVSGMTELPFRVSRECSARCLSVFMGVPVAEGMTWLILDSGAGGVSLIDRKLAPSFHLDPTVKEQRLKYEVAKGISVDSPVMIADMIMDGNLGQPFMSQYVITFDLVRGRMWVAQPLS